jgi:putative ABC transport system ATP-binding protein
MPAMICLEDVHKVYETGNLEVHAVRGVTAEIQRGEFVAIMGPSGSGKSTLMHILGCLDRVTRGRYLLDGTDIFGLDRDAVADLRNRTFGFIFQSFNLVPRTTALENVELPLLCSRRGLRSQAIRARAGECLERVGLASRMRHLPNQLSGGQQQRVAIARALVNDPRIIFADEPTGNLDSATSTEIMNVIRDLNESGVTIVMVTHETDVASFCQRILYMRDGRVASDQHSGGAEDRPLARSAIDHCPMTVASAR